MRDLESEAIAQRLTSAVPEPGAPRPGHKAELRERLLRSEARPVRNAAGEPVFYTVVHLDVLGQIFVAYTDQGICFLTAATTSAEQFEAMVERRYGCPVQRDDTRQERFQAALQRWLAGKAQDVKIDLTRVSPFERQVLEKAREIGRGRVFPYQWLAKEVGKPGASRAIGNVMARNPVPLLIPCHRVVAGSGVIGNYSMGGPAIKRQLLELEGVDVNRLHDLARQGYRFKASKTTGIFCYPTCREIQPHNELLFKSAYEAQLAGYRPCKLCRPG